MDILLEGDTDGLSFLSNIKNNSSLNHIPVILISSLDSSDIITEGLKLGANDYITKPFNLKQLLLKIKNLLKLGDLTRQLAVLEKEIPFIISKSRSTDLIEKLNTIIERIIGTSEDISIVDIANELHISQSTLTRLVKSHFSMTTNAYIMNKKLDKSKLLIQSNKGLAIKEISFSLGFASVSYFSKCYKKRFGQYPSSAKK